MLIQNDKLYDILNKIQRWLPSLGILYLALCQIWGLPYGQKVNETIVAVATFMAATLEISSAEYHKKNIQDLLGDITTGAFDSEAFDENKSE